MKIIGCGNPDRGDDQVGVVVSERLRELGFEAETHTGDPLAIIERWQSCGDVILIDAVVTGGPVGTVHVWDFSLPSMPDFRATSSHGFDIAGTIALARILNCLPARLRVYGIEARHFDQGAEMSAEVVRAIDMTVRQIAAELYLSSFRSCQFALTN